MNLSSLYIADTFTAFRAITVGTQVLDRLAFTEVALNAIAEHDFTKDRVPGQGFILCSDAIPFLSAGVGPRSSNPDDYVCQAHRGRVSAFLKRVFAAPVKGCALIVYTKAAYLADPDIDPVEQEHLAKHDHVTHVLVAVLAFAGPTPPLEPYRLVANLAGGNNEALVWTADEIRAQASASIEYDREWCVVAG